MTNALGTAAISPLITEGLPESVFEALVDPLRDPALVMPDFPLSIQDKDRPAVDIPSVDDLEAALNAHVRDGISPLDLIKSVFSPFNMDAGYIHLDPGKGKQRPSYALDISPFGLAISRAATRIVAERLHAIAENLAELEIGNRAPDEAPKLRLEISGHHHETFTSLRARDINTARHAYIVAFGRAPGSIHVDLDKSAGDIIPHIIAAREFLAEEQIGAPKFRQQAVDLIAATQDLRAAATIALRQNPDVSARERYWIEIVPSAPDMIRITDEDDERQSGHARVQFTARHRELIDALTCVARRHKVLNDLPDRCRVQLDGDASFMMVEIVDTKAPQISPKRKISCSTLEYEAISDLADHLSGFHQPQPAEDARWHMSIRWATRSKMSWDLTGPTLAHAIARAVRGEGGRASMVLFDLLIDLACDKDGEAVEVDLRRVV